MYTKIIRRFVIIRTWLLLFRYLTISIILLVSHMGAAQGLESKIRAVFIYNFTRHINWPESAGNGNFVIGVVSDEALATELEKMTSNIKLNNTRSVVVKRIASNAAIGPYQNYHILYFSNKDAGTIKALSDASVKIPVLLISEGAGMARKGSAMSFYKDPQDKIKFELNKQSLEARNLKASVDLVRLATLVEN